VADITARHVAEAALVEARSAAAENAAWQELSRQQHLMINVIAHELKTPLTMVFGFSELLLQREIPPDLLRSQLEVIHLGATRLNQLVTNIVDLSLLESGEVKLERQPLQLATLAPIWAAELESPIEVRLEADSDLPQVDGDEARLRQAFHHLLRNALAVTPPEAAVTIGLRAEGVDRVAVSFTDQGPGISPEQLDHVLDPFFRTDSAHSQAMPGVGIGLALVRRIAQLHGGDVSVRSSPGDGSTFDLRLPVASAS
jgi:two-component system sensor histidine kinase BaeS